MKKIFLLLIAVSFAIVINAQTKTTADFYVDVPDLKTGTLDTIAITKNEALLMDSIVDRIVRVVGLKKNFYVIPTNNVTFAQAYNMPNAFNGSDRVIYYNPAILKQLNKQDSTTWKIIGIVAHEMGHHLNGHIQQNIKGAPKLEIEADEFSGFVVNVLGGTLNNALACIISLPKEEATISHPSKADRMIAVITGWQLAQRRIKNITRTDTLVMKYIPTYEENAMPKWHFGVGIGNSIINPFNDAVRWNRSTFNSMQAIATLGYKLQVDYALYKEYIYANASIYTGSSTGANYVAGYNHLGHANNPYIIAGYQLNSASLSYKTNISALALGAKFSTAEFLHCRAMLQLGASFGKYATTINALDASNNKYDFSELPFSKTDAIAKLKTMYDASYETKGETDGSNIFYTIQLAPTLQYYIKKRFYLQLQYAFDFTSTGWLDSYNWNEPSLDGTNNFTPSTQITQNDNLGMFTIGFGYVIWK
jgi:predicted Zn-dependent protease with MMP-like domain